MPSHSSYLLRLQGKVKDPKLAEEICKFFEKKPTQGEGVPGTKLGKGWPNGFLLKDYQICVWDCLPEPYGDGTVVSFRAEAHHRRKGSLYVNSTHMIPEVQWFYEYHDYQWHIDLSAQLAQWKNVIEFRGWQWYCGNGGQGA